MTKELFYESEVGEILTVIDKDDSNQAIKVRTQDGEDGWIVGYEFLL